MKLNDKLMDECQKYFGERSVFHKVFTKFWKKYESLNHMGGSITLTNLTAEEKEQLGGFVGKDYYGKNRITLSYKTVENALQKSRFARLDFQAILEEYFQNSLVGKKEQRKQKDQKLKRGFERLLREAKNPSEEQWLLECQKEKNKDYKYLCNMLADNEDVCVSVLGQVFLAGANLPVDEGEYEMLPVFATRITKNPHFFDMGKPAHRMLIAYLSYLFRDQLDVWGNGTSQGWELLYLGGILKDDLSNFVLVYGLHGKRKDGSFHQGMEGFAREKEPIQLTLQSLAGIERIFSDRNQIYMVENPAVFSYLCKKYPAQSFICGNGQLRQAVWVLLGKLEEDVTVYYAGDFDPEGLGIAQRLKNRFPEQIVLWHYDVELYRKYRSERLISSSRIKKLEGIVLPELQDLCKAMREDRVAAYQEAMLEEYWIRGDYG